MTTICTTQSTFATTKSTLAQNVSRTFKSALKLIVEKFRTRKQQRINRLAFLQMLNLNEHILNDIGVSREDVIWASNLPVNVNAALELEKIRAAKKTTIR